MIPHPFIPLVALFGTAFSLATVLQPKFAALDERRPRKQDALGSILGDSQRIFANHFYLRADKYFHSGYYPTIFDNHDAHQTAHIAEDAGIAEGKNKNEEEEFLGQASDWIDAHGRKHYASIHTHLGEDAPGGSEASVEREILPWLKFAATLDPNKVETYTVAAYWLRQIGNPVQAELFLREGLNLNPQDPELTFELGRCRSEANDSERARNLWELAWVRWQKQELGKSPEEQNQFLANRILMNLAVLESQAGNRERSLYWLQSLVPLKLNPTEVLKRIDEVKAGKTLAPIDASPPKE